MAFFIESIVWIVSKIFKALSDPTRLKIVDFLIEKERCACEIFKKIERAQSTISQQLTKLEDLGIVESRREGRSVIYKLTSKEVRKILKIFKEERC
jgi:DNA-binding transcriptional ArsR family regulator